MIGKVLVFHVIQINAVADDILVGVPADKVHRVIKAFARHILPPALQLVPLPRRRFHLRVAIGLRGTHCRRIKARFLMHEGENLPRLNVPAQARRIQRLRPMWPLRQQHAGIFHRRYRRLWLILITRVARRQIVPGILTHIGAGRIMTVLFMPRIRRRTGHLNQACQNAKTPVQTHSCSAIC